MSHYFDYFILKIAFVYNNPHTDLLNLASIRIAKTVKLFHPNSIKT